MLSIPSDCRCSHLEIPLYFAVFEFWNFNFQLQDTLVSIVGSEEETCSKTAAGCLGSFCSSIEDDELDRFLQNNIFGMLMMRHF